MTDLTRIEAGDLAQAYRAGDYVQRRALTIQWHAVAAGREEDSIAGQVPRECLDHLTQRDECLEEGD